MGPIVKIKMLILSIKCRNGLSHICIGENWFKLSGKKLDNIKKNFPGFNPIIPLTEIYPWEIVMDI